MPLLVLGLLEISTKLGFNQNLAGGFVELVNKHIHSVLFIFSGDHNQLTGAGIGHYFASFVSERTFHRRHHIGSTGVFELNNPRDEAAAVRSGFVW